MSHEDTVKNNRFPIAINNVERGVGEFEAAWLERLNKKGYGIFISTHEILGVVNEEHHELVEAIKNNDLENIREELMDIAVACIHGIASIDTKKMDW